MSTLVASMTRAIRLALLPVAVGIAVLSAAAELGAQQLAIVVNQSSDIDNLTLDQVRRIFLGQSLQLPNGKHADVAFLAPEQGRFAKQVLGFPADAVRRRWVALVFRSESNTLPPEFARPEQLKQFLLEHETGVVFLPLSAVDARMKVVRINGKSPNDPGYPLT